MPGSASYALNLCLLQFVTEQQVRTATAFLYFMISSATVVLIADIVIKEVSINNTRWLEGAYYAKVNIAFAGESQPFHFSGEAPRCPARS